MPSSSCLFVSSSSRALGKREGAGNRANGPACARPLELPVNARDMGATMSLLSRLFAPKTDPRDAMRPLWHAVVAEARRPAWYTDAGVADTVNGRYEMVSAVYALVLLRMERDGELARDTAFLTELYVEDMEAQLREFGVGDVVVGKRMTKLMGATGGRIAAYHGGILHGLSGMTESVERNMPLVDAANAQRIASDLIELWSRLGRTDEAALLSGKIAA